MKSWLPCRLTKKEEGIIFTGGLAAASGPVGPEIASVRRRVSLVPKARVLRLRQTGRHARFDRSVTACEKHVAMAQLRAYRFARIEPVTQLSRSGDTGAFIESVNAVFQRLAAA